MSCSLRWMLIFVVICGMCMPAFPARDTILHRWGLVPEGQDVPDFHFLNAGIAVGGESECRGVVFMIGNNTEKDLWIERFLIGSNLLTFDLKDKQKGIGIYAGPDKCYTVIPANTWSIEYRSFEEIKKNLLLQNWTIPFCTMFWTFYGLNSEMDIGLGKIYFIAADPQEPYDFSSRFDDPDSVNLKIAKVVDDEHYSFAAIISNNTRNDIVIDDFRSGDTRLKIRFPDGKEYVFPGKAGAKKLTVPAGNSVYQFFNLEEVLRSGDDCSMENLRYGISELSLELHVADGSTRSAALPLVVFAPDSPVMKDDSRYLMESAPSEEIFRNNAFVPSKFLQLLPGQRR